MDKKKIVVTGGAGFIGSHIANYWAGNNAEVHIIDNLKTGFIDNISQHENIIFHKGSITDRDLVFSVLQNAIYVHHLAAFVSVPESIKEPEECHEINVNGLFNVLDASKEFGIKKVVFSSSAAVYGDNPESPKSINTKPSPKSPYASTKYDGENYLKLYQALFNLGTISLRYFNVFGPRQNPNSQYAAAIPIFVTRALKNEPLVIYGDGEQTRDFIFVDDVVDSNILAATSEITTGVFNIASGKAITINDIAQIVIEETKSMSRVIYEEERPGDIKHSLASIEETKDELGFTPKYNLLQGMRYTIKYFIDKLS